MRGVTRGHCPNAATAIFQPALPMRGVTGLPIEPADVVDISTRTPHAGSDPCGARPAPP